MSTNDDPMKRLQDADPIDAAELIATWSASDAKASLLQEITTMPTDTIAPHANTTPIAHQRPTAHQPGGRRPLVLAAAAVIAALAITGAAVLTGSPNPAYAISETSDGLVQVNVLAGFRDGDALVSDLSDRGIDARVQTVAASPSMVGTVEVGTSDGQTAGIQVGGSDGTSEVFDWTVDPSVFEGTLVVTVFVAASDDEQFAAAQEVFEPGEKLDGLHCALGEPMRASDVATYLDRVGVTAEWFVVTSTDDPSITNSVVVDDVPNGIVLSGYSTDNSHVRFDVLLDGQTLAVAPAGGISDFGCTPADAEKWR